MLEKNNKISVVTKMIGIGDEKTPQLIAPQNSLTNFHARMGISEKSMNLINSGVEHRAHIASCPHCQNMAKNFLYLESLIRANGNPKSKCSLRSSTLRYVEYVNKSILDVFAKNASIMEAAKKYNNSKPRFRLPKLMSRVARLSGGGKHKQATPAAAKDADAGASTSGSKRQLVKKTKGKATDSGATATTSTLSTKATTKKGKKLSEKSKSKDITKTKVAPNKKTGSKASLKTPKAMGSHLSTRLTDGTVISGTKAKKSKTVKSKKTAKSPEVSAMALKKHGSKTKRRFNAIMRAGAA